MTGQGAAVISYTDKQVFMLLKPSSSLLNFSLGWVGFEVLNLACVIMLVAPTWAYLRCLASIAIRRSEGLLLGAAELLEEF